MIYVPLGYKVDRLFWRRRMRKAGRPIPVKAKPAKPKKSMDVRTFTVGPVQENCHIAVRRGRRRS